MTNHYRTLGVDPQAEAVVIRSAYLALIRRYHPDKGGEEADDARAKEVTAAWEVLRDPERRAAYDEARKARFQPDATSAVFTTTGPRVRGGVAGRNLFLVLAAGTVALGWWALQQPLIAPPGAGQTIASGPADPVLPVPAIRPAEDEKAAAREQEAAELPRLPEVMIEPEVEVAVVLPPLPVAEPARLPVRTADVRPASRSQPVAERAQPVPARPRSEERRSAAAEVPPPARVDLAPLERHLQLLTDQSLRYGTEAKRSRLFSTRESFLRRLRDCDSDACKRDAYLRRNAEVGEIMRN